GLWPRLGPQDRRGAGDVHRGAGRSAAADHEPHPAAGGSGGTRTHHLARLHTGRAANRVSRAVRTGAAIVANISHSSYRECGGDPETVRDLAHTVVEHRVARDPEDPVLLPVPAKREPDHVAHDRAAQRGAMATGCGGDLDRRSTRRLEPRSRPGPKAVSVTPE